MSEAWSAPINRATAHVGSLDSDLDGQLILQTAQNMSISDIFLTAKKGRNGALMLKNLEELLRAPTFVSEVGNDLIHYFRVLFTDPRGWNLRNTVCHGMLPPSSFSRSVAGRVFHAVLILGQLRPASTDEESKAAE